MLYISEADDGSRNPSVTRVRTCALSISSRRRHTRSEEHTSELQSLTNLVCRLLLEKKKERRQPVPEPSASGMKMMMNGVEHDMLMPGMLTEAQMKQLDEARGPEFDQVFLTFMIQHHNGAVSMVKELFDTYGAGQDELVFKFASDVNVDQTTEIARMERMLFAITVE